MAVTNTIAYNKYAVTITALESDIVQTTGDETFYSQITNSFATQTI
jgi:hypothetical protein